MGFEQVFDNLTFKHMTALRKKIQSVTDYFSKLLFLATCNLQKQILTMIARIKLLAKFYLACFVISTRDMTLHRLFFISIFCCSRKHYSLYKKFPFQSSSYLDQPDFDQFC